MKKLIAYSSVSHLGFCMLGMFAAQPARHGGQRPADGQSRLSTGGLFLIVA